MGSEGRLDAFLDTNVLIAGMLSASGASAAVLDLAEAGVIVAVVSEQVLIEADRTIEVKLPQLAHRYRQYIKALRPVLVEDPSPADVRKAAKVIDTGDAPILAAAMKHRVDYLVTLDRKHFHSAMARRYAPFPIVTPAQFLEAFRSLFSPQS